MIDNSTSKEKVLRNVRKALLTKDLGGIPKIDFETEVFAIEGTDLQELFSKNLQFHNGKFFYCQHIFHFIDQLINFVEKASIKSIACFEINLKNSIEDCGFKIDSQYSEIFGVEASITGCVAAIARTGSIILSSNENMGRGISVFPPIHIVVIFKDQLKYDMKDYLNGIKNSNISELPSMFTIITGPSRTSDIEKTLVLGAHGPKELCVFYINEERALDH